MKRSAFALRGFFVPTFVVVLGLDTGFGSAHAQTAVAHTTLIDPQRTVIEFKVDGRFNMGYQGYFASVRGVRNVLASGQVSEHIHVDSNSLYVNQSDLQSRFAKGAQFLDVTKYPLLEFESDWHKPEVTTTGGKVLGSLTMHGVKRPEQFEVEAPTCNRPGIDCDIIVNGTVDRRNYGMMKYSAFLGQTVQFRIRVRLQTAP